MLLKSTRQLLEQHAKVGENVFAKYASCCPHSLFIINFVLATDEYIVLNVSRSYWFVKKPDFFFLI